jgi:hypothetical protein
MNTAYCTRNGDHVKAFKRKLILAFLSVSGSVAFKNHTYLASIGNLFPHTSNESFNLPNKLLQDSFFFSSGS